MSSLPPSNMELYQKLSGLEVQLSSLRECVVSPDFSPTIAIRDYFAGQALAGLVCPELLATNDNAHIAATAYSIADAMLAERSKQEGK